MSFWRRYKGVTAIALALSILCGVLFTSGVALAETTNDKAERFISLVASFGDVFDLDERLELIEYVRSEGVYFDDEGYPGISQALASLFAIETDANAKKQASEGFMAAVDVALLTDSRDYVAIRAALDKAEEYENGIDLTYDGVVEARSIFGELSSELKGKETFTDEFLRAVANIADKESYRDRRDAYKYALEYMSSDKFIADYPGVFEAKEVLEDTAEAFKGDIELANGFISAVASIGSGESIAHDLILAYFELLGVDRTVDGVAGALAILNAAVEEYNSTVEQINSDFGHL